MNARKIIRSMAPVSSRTYFLILFLMGSFSVDSWAQDVKELRREADLYWAAEKYDRALPLLDKIHDVSPEDLELKYQLGVCYYHARKIPQALRFLDYYIENQKDPINEAYWYRGKAFHTMFEHKRAIQNYKIYLKELDEGDPARIYAKNAVKYAANGLKQAGNQSSIFVENLGDQINSNGDEFGPVFSPTRSDRIYFSSARSSSLGGLRNRDGVEDEINGDYNADMFIAVLENGVWQEAKALSYLLNSPRQDIVQGFSQNGRRLYYFKGYSELQGEFFVDTFKVNIEERSLFSEPFDSPAFAQNGDTDLYFFNDTTLLFSSRRSGGYGGYDLYITQFKEGYWGQPENLGPTINTPYDERSPFLSKDGRTIYYSTNNITISVGDMDIVRAQYRDDLEEWGSPKNMGSPLNSANDDTGFQLSSDGLIGYFASDRVGSKGKRDLFAAYFKGAQEEQTRLSEPLVFVDVPAYKRRFGLLKGEGGATALGETEGAGEITQYYLESLFYEDNGEILTPRNMKQLNLIGRLLTDYPGLQVLLTSHSDGSDPEQFDLFFSIKRAEKAAQYLVDNGVPFSSIQLRAVGDSYPVANNILNGQPDPLGHRLNRRMDFIFLNAEGFPIDIVIKDPRIKGPLSNSAWEYFQESISGLSYKVQVTETKQMLNSDVILKYPNAMIEKNNATGEYQYTLGLYQNYAEAKALRNALLEKGMASVYIVPYVEGLRVPLDDLSDYYQAYPDLVNYVRRY